MAPIVNSGLHNAMLQIAKSENMVDRLQIAEFAGYQVNTADVNLP